MALFAMLMVSCVPEAEKATVETREITDVTSSSARVICNVSDDGGAEVSSRGICWGSSANPTIETSSSMGAGSGIGNYECEISGLESNTTYYVRAYATNSAGISYGEEKSFKTLNEGDDGEISGHGYVDLGLPSGKKWATCNVGADKPEDYGDYFAWGETTTKSDYSSSNSLTYGVSYSELQAQGIIDGNGNLTPSYDAAAANWGGGWRMPTREECQELVDYCEWEWTEVNGVEGKRVIGPNGSCIFLPAAGFRYELSLRNAGDYGYFWSSTPYVDYDSYAYHFYFSRVGAGVLNSRRGDGVTIRPITE